MKKVAVFGNAGGGKSTLARRLAEITGLPLYTLDIVQFRDGRYWAGEPDGGKMSDEDYLKLHADILNRDRWIIDGYGSLASAWERFAAADTLVRRALLGRHEAFHREPVPEPERLAGGQPAMGKHARQLSRRVALP